jgi:hypothetical protein
MNRIVIFIIIPIIVVMELTYFFYNPLTSNFHFNEFINKIANDGALDKPSVRENMSVNSVYPVAEKNKKFFVGIMFKIPMTLYMNF